MPNTKPGVHLDERGICNACRSVEKKKKIDWDNRYEKLQKIAKEIKNQKNPFYDCLVPVSGGKNSWYQAYVASEKLGLKTLCVVLAAHIPTTEGIYNLNEMVDDLNIDFKGIKPKKLFYDVIYNPPQTKFLESAKNLGHNTLNGKSMFLYQAQKAFQIWHDIVPEIDKNILNFFEND